VWSLDDIGDQCLIVRAHSSTLGILELNYDGTLMATASEKGTLIRIFSTKSGEMLQELRRGTENVVLFSVNFHFQDDWLSCISDSGTLHIFNLLKQGDANMTVQEKEKQMKKAKQAVSKNRKSM
jgi:WD repeat-containing protein 45